jgi:hypothetical protein
MDKASVLMHIDRALACLRASGNDKHALGTVLRMERKRVLNEDYNADRVAEAIRRARTLYR